MHILMRGIKSFQAKEKEEKKLDEARAVLSVVLCVNSAKIGNHRITQTDKLQNQNEWPCIDADFYLFFGRTRPIVFSIFFLNGRHHISLELSIH